jgi:arylsulfatase A-like enzyme
MTDEPQREIRRESAGRGLARAAGLAAMFGALAGSAEALKLFATADVRSAAEAIAIVAIAVAGYALAGALLAVPSAVVALALYGRPRFMAVAPSTCAVVGVCVALAAQLASSAVYLHMLLALAVVATMAALLLRELFAWWSLRLRCAHWLALLAVMLLAAGAFGIVQSRKWAAAPHIAPGTNVLLVTIDTLRADALGCYGNHDARTPVIDRLASEGVVFEDATSQANTTGPSHTTILSGLYPAEHGALANGIPLRSSAKTLGDWLRKTHDSAGFVSGFPLVDRACGLGQRFDHYDDALLAWSWMPRAAEQLHLAQNVIRCAESRGVEVHRPDRPAGETVDAAVAWLREHQGYAPFFCWLHLYDPHAPYAPPAKFAQMHDPQSDGHGGFDWYRLTTAQRDELVRDPRAVAHMKALYAGEVSYADEQLGRVVEALGADLAKTLVIVTADHGEGMGEHGYWFDHGSYLYDEELRVPLIVRMPGAQSAGMRIANQVRLLDIAPTVLDVVGDKSERELSGASLLPLLQGRSDANDRPSFAVSDIAGDVTGFDIDGRRAALRVRGKKVIWSSSYWLDTQRVESLIECFDIARDPREQHAVAGAGADGTTPCGELEKRLEAWRMAASATSKRGAIDAETLRQLRKLGY